MSAVDYRIQFQSLLAERYVAAEQGLDRNAAYMDDLETDLAAARTAYVLTAVTEIAVLRADLSGELTG
jgi:hypothetical protein